MSTVMIRKRRRLSDTSDNSEDGSPQRRKQLKSAPIHFTRKDIAIRNISQHEPVIRMNSDVSTSSKFVSRPRRRRNRVPISSTSESSTSSEDEVILHPARRGSLRALSDYETGDSTGSDRAHSSQINPTEVEGDRQNECHNYVRNHTKANSYSDSSSDESIIQPIYRDRSKRVVRPISTSDSSDSGMLIGFRRTQKRMRLKTSSEESDSAPSKLATDIGKRLARDDRPQTSNQVRSNDRRIRQNRDPRESNFVSSINLHDRKSHITDVHQNSLDPTAYRGVNMSQRDERRRETSTESDSDIRPRVMQRRNVNFFTDSSDSNEYDINFIVNSFTSDSDESIPVRVTRSRSDRLRSVSEDELDSDDDDTQIQIPRPSRHMKRFPTDDEVDGDESIQSASEDELDSDDDDTQIQTSRPSRHAMRFPTDDEDDSDESIPVQVCRSRSNRPRPLSDLSDDELVSGTDPSVSSAKRDNLDEVSTKATGGGSSESDEETERCPICFSKFVLQEIGTPATCEHKFCATCLQTWAKNNNTCPVDRKLFTSIVIRGEIGGEVTRRISIETPPVRGNDDDSSDEQLLFALIGDLDDVLEVDENSIDEVAEDSTDGDGPDEVCCICSQMDRPDAMIVCDYCNEVYHMDCVNPPLQYVPASYWHCPSCEPLDAIYFEY